MSSKSMQKMARQGDVLLTRVAKLPKGLTAVPRDKGRVVLAYGEVTGHAHAIFGSRVTLFMETGSGSAPRRFLEVKEATELRHEEHATVAIPAGLYEVGSQREYTPEEIRNVAD